MITVISGTNRHDSMTLRVAHLYLKLLKNAAPEGGVKLLNLEEHHVWQRDEAFREMEAAYLIPAEKFVFIMPEYNGSFPGVLKLMMDNSDIRKTFWHKKAALVGLADGRAGNLRGLDHMTNILNYLKVLVWHHKIPISRINEIVHPNGHLLQPETEMLIQQHVREILAF